MSSALSTQSSIVRADASTIHNKFLVGYQGWFTCHGDGEPIGPGHHGWLHWFDYPVPDGGRINVDVWPDTSEYSPSELYPAPGFKHENGEQAFLFSSRHPKTVQRHFHWMAENGVDGAFLQRFLGATDVEGGDERSRNLRDEIGDRVQEAAEKEGRVFAIMYDLAGVAGDRTMRMIQEDWSHLLHKKKVLDSPNYLHHNGKPVIAIWGFGFDHTKHTPEQLRSVINFIRSNTPGGAYIMGGSPAGWRSAHGDADRNPEFVAAWMECFDAVSPWTVGRYNDEKSADSFAEDRIKGDVEFIEKWKREKGRHVDYIPVVHPGGSALNMSQGKWDFNGAPRMGGRFLWRQLYNIHRFGAARIIYAAMWDEYDEGTNFVPVVSHRNQLPHDEQRRFKLMALDEDGYDLPSDWYMRIAGYASESLKGLKEISEHFPEKELKDWWSSHPRYEQQASGSSSEPGTSTDIATKGQTYAQWLASVEQTKESDELPPPPYSLVADTSGAAQTVITPRPEPPLATRPNPPPQPQRPVSAGASGPPPVHHNSRPKPPPTPPRPSTRPDAGTRPPPIHHQSRPSSSTSDFLLESPWDQQSWPQRGWAMPQPHSPSQPEQLRLQQQQQQPYSQHSHYGNPYNSDGICPINRYNYDTEEYGRSNPSTPQGFNFPRPELSEPYPPHHEHEQSKYQPAYMPVPSPTSSLMPRPQPPPRPRSAPNVPQPQPTSSNPALNFVRTQVIDRVAGEERRRQFESRVEGLAQKGNSLLNKYKK
ncbi:uncharacterized protein STEHIDRAFT_136079 [Stereum hirsutum FP-91666 SS1]|uniref:uncharacterized protein n=1 Tax=Stereum hirsutum (strain FP-91666) TaxID=721885 RepID=UPI000440A32A|nr:uncharacterized protein STEHIDRAFT_136079 [Stereum hirsutum FP-91666 SS1]EIM92038.1 hypothetical protein STEHIDRAFT_136079 [Stereum hirsutum FP-91666 SS1]